MSTVTPISQTRARLFEIIKDRSFKEGEFTLASGRKSRLYFDLRPTLTHPEGVDLAAEAFLAAAYPLNPEFMGGLAIGAVPATGAIALKSFQKGRPVPTFFVREKAKEHGTRQQVEGLGPGESMEGRRVIVIDDVATSGGSIIKAAGAVRELGALVENAIVLVDREEGAAERLKEEGIDLIPIFRAHEFLTPSGSAG